MPAFTVGVTADRRGDEQALMLTRLGFRVVRGPALGTVMVTGDGPLRSVTEELISHPPDYLVANTGIGIRSWVTAAGSWGLGDALVGSLGTGLVVARGPKAAGAVRSLGLPVAWRASSEQLGEVAEHLLAQPLAGRRVAMQLHGEDSEAFAAALREAGADVVEVPVYRWVVPADCRPALALVEATCEGEIDAVTFTSGPAVRNLVALAGGVDLGEALLAAFNGGVIAACVGPVCAGVARQEGIEHPVVPEHWRLGSLVRLVADELGRRAA